VLGNPSGPRVLVVDDVEEMRLLIGRALAARGYQVDVAATLTEARRMEPTRYDALLIDAYLDHEQGMDLVESLRTEDPAAVKRCLVMTGGTADGLPEGVSYLAKPFQLDQARIAPGSDAPPAAVAAPPHAGEPPHAGSQTWQLLRLTRQIRARERHELADFLHDGPIQELTSVTLELQMMSRLASSAHSCDGMLQRLNKASGSLRWLIDGPWPFLEPETRLAETLGRRTAWLAAGSVIVHADEQPADLAAADMSVVADVAELMLFGMMTVGPPADVQIAVRTDESVILVDVSHTPAQGGDPAAAQQALDVLAAALGASAHFRTCGPRWQAQIVLRRPAASPLDGSPR
jgi:CheY-like chemotaxis protein